jgi:hypothetical protein
MKKHIINNLCLVALTIGISLTATAMAGVQLQKELHIITKGIPEGVPVDFKVKSHELNGHFGFDSGNKTRLMDLKPGNYKLELPDILYSGYRWAAKSPMLSLQLTKDGKIVNNLTKKRIAKLVSLAYTLKGMPTTVSTDPIYPTNTAGLWSCDPILLNGCIQLDTAAQIGDSTVVVKDNGHVYTTNGRYIYSCDGIQGGSCVQLDDAGKSSPIVSLIYANNRLYAGLNSGILWSCDPNAANSCTNFDNAGKNTQILSLAYGNNRLFAGLSNGILWSCDSNVANQCQNLDTADAAIATLAYGDGRLYAGINDKIGNLWSCDSNVANSCTNLDQSYQDYYSMIYANSKIYAGLNDGTLLSCDPSTVAGCKNFSGGISPIMCQQARSPRQADKCTSYPPYISEYSEGTARLYAKSKNNLLSCDPTTLECIVLDNSL